MAERGLAALDAGQRERLAVLGFELLSLRSTASNRAGTTAVASAVGTPECVSKLSDPCRRLVLRVASGDLFAGPQAALLRAVICALGLSTSEVSQEVIAGLPTIAFGTPADAPAILAPAPEQLRDARAKRALWPVLRGLRRQLQGVSERE